MPLDGPFSVTKFLGASVLEFDANVGWNEQASSISVKLVEDPDAGDQFVSPGRGVPVKFAMDGFEFQGLIQSDVRIDDFQGSPAYRVRVEDPREVLAGVQVILGSYNGPTSAMPNLLNAYGYWESKLGFGGALTNGSGMVWQAPFDILNLSTTGGGLHITPAGSIGIKPALEAMSAGPGPYGGRPALKGHSYQLDLSGLPTPPPYYRIGGPGRSVLDMASELCQDAGCDYQVRLDGDRIYFVTVSRTAQPQLGTIQQFINSRPGVIARSVGVELRNDITNAVLLGGDIHQLVMIHNTDGGETIWPYWGKDASGKAILGKGAPEDKHEADLNASEVADIIGDTTYHITIPELRSAAADFDSWAAYVLRWEPDKGKKIGLVSAIDSKSDLQALFPDVLFQRDLIAQRQEEADKFGAMNEIDYWTKRAQRVYDFVSRYANEFFGRKFLVRLPFQIYWKFVPETIEKVASDEVSQDGGFLPDGSQPLSLPFQEENKFITNDGRFDCFVAFDFHDTMDLQKVAYENAATDGKTVWMRATADDEVLYLDNSIYPHCVVTLADPIYHLAPDPLGGIEDLAKAIDVPADLIAVAAGLRHGSFPVRIQPAPFRPQSAAIPMKDNRNSYGPWGTFPPFGTLGAPGKVLFSRDESLTPWEYGDYDTLNKAATAQIAGAATRMQEAETGSFEEPGAPSVQLGDALTAGGPNVTGIACRVSTQGVTTSYTMQTYTPQFGAFARSNAERLKRLGVAAQQSRRQLRDLYQRGQQQAQLQATARRGFLENASRAVEQMSPHEAIYGTMTFASASQTYRTQCSTGSVAELFANVRPDKKEIYQATGGMTLEGLVRPFSTALDKKVAGGMPHYEQPWWQLQVDTTPTSIALDPIRGSDIDLLVNGIQYDPARTMHRLKGAGGKGLDYDNARGIGLRTPIVLEGWGFELSGKPIPNSGDETQPVDTWDSTWLKDHKLHPERWRAGPLDVAWDDWRKVWTIPTGLKAILVDDLRFDEEGARALVQVSGHSLPGYIKAYSWFDSITPANTRVWLSFYPLERRWYVTAADCQPGDPPADVVPPPSV